MVRSGSYLGRSIWYDANRYEKLLLVIMQKVKYMHFMESLKTKSLSAPSEEIITEIRRSVYSLKNDLNDKNRHYFKNFLETFAARILRDCATILDENRDHTPPLKKWEELLKLYMRGLLLHDEEYDMALYKSRNAMPIAFLEICSKKLFHARVDKSVSPNFFKLMSKIGQQVYEEDKKISKNNHRSILPYEVLDTEECSADTFGRPKRWASTFTVDEEEALRDVHSAPRVKWDSIRLTHTVFQQVQNQQRYVITENEETDDDLSDSSDSVNIQESVSHRLNECNHSLKRSNEQHDVRSLPKEKVRKRLDANAEFSTIPSTTLMPSTTMLSDESITHVAIGSLTTIDIAEDEPAITITDCTSSNTEPMTETIVIEDDDEPEVIFTSVAPLNQSFLKTTDTSMAWGSVPIGQYQSQEYPIVNNTDTIIKLECYITQSNDNFKFLDGHKMTTVITIKVQPMETYALAVVFSPHSIGAAVGKMTLCQCEFQSNSKMSQLAATTSLFGYGGDARVTISNDYLSFSLADWRPVGALNARIRLENSGDLSAYAKLSITPRMSFASVERHWKIQPTELILSPKEIQWVTIEFRPCKADMVIRGETVVGTMKILYGDEPTRWRIRKLYDTIQTQRINNNSRESIFSTQVQSISRVFPGETRSIPHKNIDIRDLPQDMEMLSQRINRAEVTLRMRLR